MNSILIEKKRRSLNQGVLGKRYLLSSPKRSPRTSSMEPGTEKELSRRKKNVLVSLMPEASPQDAEFFDVGFSLSSFFIGHEMSANSLTVTVP